MKSRRFAQFLAAGALICIFTAAALANDMRVRWEDPPVTTTAGIYNLTQTSTTYTGILLSSPSGCPTVLGVTSPGGCAGFFNETGGTLTSFDLQFTVPPGSSLIGQSISCPASGSLFTVNNCSSFTNLMANEMVTLDFSGASIPSAPPLNGSLFYLVVEGANPGDFPSSGLSGSVSDAAEPSSLLLLAAGIGVLGLWRFGNWLAPTGGREPS